MPDTSVRWSPKKRSTRDPAYVDMTTAEARDQSATPGLQSASARPGSRASATQHESVYHERMPLIRRGERESVEGFMWDKQRGQRALQKRRQIREDVHVYATEQALETSLQRQGVHLLEDDIVLDEHQAFEDPHFAAKLPAASHAESHSRRRSQLTRRSTGISSMRLHNIRASQRNVLGESKEPDDGRASEQRWGIDDGDLDSSVFGGDDQDFLTAETLRTQAKEKKRLAQEERDLRQAQKERAEKIFFFYEQVDQVVARIANTLSTVNKSEMHFAMKLGDKFVNDPSIEASKDIKSSRTSLMQLLGPGDESVKPQGPPAVSFWTEEEAEEFRLTKESLEKLTASIHVSTFSESLSEVGEWVHGRRKQSMAEEKEYYTLMKEVEEQEVEAEGASRSVRLMLREKEQRAESKLQRFGDALHKIKTKGKQLNALLARYDADAVALQSQQTQETIAVLESQIAIMRARVLEADGKLASAVPSKGENQEIEDKLRVEQSRLDLASADVLEELDRIQAKNAVLIKQVAASGDVLHSLENIEQQVQLQVAFKEKAREAYGKNQNQRLEVEDDDEEKEDEEDKREDEEEQQGDGEGKDEGLTEGASRASHESSSIEESSSPSLSSGVSSDEESAASDEEDHAREISELETLIANAEADKLAELEEKEELSRQLTTRKHEFESMPTAMEREARLVDKINEVKRLYDDRKAPVVDKAALERQAQEAKRLEKAKQDLQEQVQALEKRLLQTQSDLQAISSSLEETQDLLAMYSTPAAGGQARKQRKTAANPRSGPRGDVGPLGDEAPAWEEENVPSRDAHGRKSSLSPREVRTLDEQREELTALFEKVYAPFQVDPDTGDRVARVRSHAVVVRSERLGDILVRKEGPSIAEELEALRCDSLKVVSIRNEIQADVERATRQLQDALARGSNGSSQEEEIQRRLVAASKQIALLGNQVSRDRAKANVQRHSIQTSHEEELRAALEDMEIMGKEVLSLKERVTTIAHEAAERASHNDRAQDLLRRQQAVHRKLNRQVTRLREEVRLNAADNPSQRATRVKRQIKALELANVKLHRKLRDLESQLQRKQIQARKRAEARQAAIRAGREVEPPNEADQLFREDDETRARKADLRKQIGKSMRQLSRWRRRWQAAKRAASLATSAQQKFTRPPLAQSQRSTDVDSSNAQKYQTGHQHIQAQQHAGFLMQDYRQQHQQYQHQQQSQTFLASTPALGGRQVLNDGCGAVAVEVRRPSLTTASRQLAVGPEAHRAMAAVAAKLDAQRRSFLSAPSNNRGLGILSVSTRPLGSPTPRSRGSPRQQKMLRSSSPQPISRTQGEKRQNSIALPTYKSPRRSLLQTLPTSLYNDTRKPRSPERSAKANNNASHAPGSGPQLYSKPLQGPPPSKQVRGFIYSEQVRGQVDKKRVLILPDSTQVRVQLPARETKNQAAECVTNNDSCERPTSHPLSEEALSGKSSSSPTNGSLLGWMEPVNIDLASRLGLN